MANAISSLLIPSLKSFNELVNSAKLRDHEREVPASAWEGELGRLRVWASNIGAHQIGQSSLDYRLRDASHISQQITKLLRDLIRSIEDVKSLTNEEISAVDAGETSSTVAEETTELQEIFEEIFTIINCLYQMSMLIRKPAQHDRLLKADSKEVELFEPFDRRHVADKYPDLDENIVKRLGWAITRRRGYLKYRERHHAKLGKGIEDIELANEADPVKPTPTISKSNVLSETVATDFHDSHLQLGDTGSNSGLSQTSYAASLEGGGAITVPSPPKESADEKPFECPYCFFIITIKNQRSWTRHVFKDIQPYSCTFQTCSVPERLYDSRRDWFKHELTMHEKDWYGPRIDQGPPAAEEQKVQSSAVSKLQSDVSTFSPLSGSCTCPLCKSAVSTVSQLERHLARHLEELALFALPREPLDEDTDGSHGLPAANAFGVDTTDSESAGDVSVGGRCPNPDCGRIFKDLKAHMLTHQPEKPEKCPILNCEYNQKGFARKYDKNRHTLTHYKGIMVCGFCTGSGSAAEKSFNRADVFKRHLTSVHSVEQAPSSHKENPKSLSKKVSSYCKDATGMCSTCSSTFDNAQVFYEHLDNCILRVIEQQVINQKNLTEVATDDDVDFENMASIQTAPNLPQAVPGIPANLTPQNIQEILTRLDQNRDTDLSATMLADRTLSQGTDEGAPPSELVAQAEELRSRRGLEEPEAEAETAISGTPPDTPSELSIFENLLGSSLGVDKSINRELEKFDPKDKEQNHILPSQKTMLSKALQKANAAVLLDNAENVKGAMDAYADACQLLQQVMWRSAGGEDRKRLEAIRNTYANRISELRGLDLTHRIPDGKTMPERPMSNKGIGQDAAPEGD